LVGFGVFIIVERVKRFEEEFVRVEDMFVLFLGDKLELSSLILK